MRYATQDLREEHQAIKVALAVMDRLADSLKTDQPVDADDLETILDFVRNFADRCHHGKEEDLIFPALQEAGIASEEGLVDELLAEHTRGRELVRAMAEMLQGVRKGNPKALEGFVSADREYVSLLTEHIRKEDKVLFVMADRQLPPEEHARLAEGFERIEQERMGPGVHERYRALLDRLRDQYLTPVT